MSPSPPYSVLSADLPKEASASTVAATVAGAGKHTLTVQGYSRLKAMNGGFLESSAFKAGGHTWKICCALNGDVPENAGFISLFLRRDSDYEWAPGKVKAVDPAASKAPTDESVVHAEYEFSLVHHRGTLIKWPAHRRRCVTRAFLERSMCGFPRFISAEDLKGSRFLKDDRFTVRCKVTVVQDAAEAFPS